MKTQKSLFEQNGGTYSQVGEVLLPNLTIGETEQRSVGKYGRMRKRYLKEQHPISELTDGQTRITKKTSLRKWL